MTDELKPCHDCGNTYLAIRIDIYKDKREFVYCDCCGCIAPKSVWNRIDTQGPVARSIEQEAQIRYAMEKLRAADAFEDRVQRLQAMIEQGHTFDWPHTDAFDDGGVAYHEAKRRIMLGSGT